MNWSFLAGGVSKGLNDAFEGANKGNLQAEGIRAGRAQEGLAQQQLGVQQEHLGLSRQQMENTLAQQAFQNRMARERFGFEQEQFGATLDHNRWQRQHGDELRGIQRGEYDLKQQMFPYERDKTIAHTNYYNNPNRGVGSGGFEQKYKNAKATALGHTTYFDAPLHVQQQIDKEYEESRPGMALKVGHAERMEERYNMLKRLAEQRLLHPNMSGSERIHLAKYMTLINQYGLALKRQQDAVAFGIPLDAQTQALLSDHTFEELWRNVTNLGNAAATRGVGAYDPDARFPAPGGNVQDIMGKYGLK